MSILGLECINIQGVRSPDQQPEDQGPHSYKIQIPEKHQSWERFKWLEMCKTRHFHLSIALDIFVAAVVQFISWKETNLGKKAEKVSETP